MDFGVDIIYVLNLPAYTERKAKILDFFNKFNITNYQFIECIAGSDLKSQQELIKEGTLNPIFIDCNGLLTKNIIGCALSHRLAYTAFINSEHANCLILEDDAMFSERMTEYILTGRLTNFIEQVKRTPYDIVMWGRTNEELLGKNTTDQTEIFKPDMLSDKYAGHAYQLNRKSAQVLLDKGLPLRFAADVFLETLGMEVISPQHSLFVQYRGHIKEEDLHRVFHSFWVSNTPKEFRGTTGEEIRKLDDSPYAVQNANIAPSFSVEKVVFNFYKPYLSKIPVKWAYIHLNT